MEVYFAIGAAMVGALLLLLVRRALARSPVDRSLVAHVAANPAGQMLATRTLNITAVFTNLNDFAEVFGRLGDQGGAALLSEYYSVMTPIVRRNHGLLNSYTFDRLFCFFGAPLSDDGRSHAAEALRAVLEMQAALVALNGRLAERGLPQVSMRAGVATGEAYVGDIGTAACCTFTAIGPAVNLARSLEKACKKFGTPNLVSMQTRAMAGAEFNYRAAGVGDGVRDNEAMEVTG